MRKIVGWVLIGLGTFLLVVGLLAVTWVPGATKKTPLDVDSETRLAGTAEKFNPGTGEVEDLDVKILSATRVDSDESTDEVALFVNTTCVTEDVPDTPECVDNKDDSRLISNSIDVFATDRSTALAVNSQEFLDKGATRHEGVINKWPFDTEQVTYPYWDGILGEAVDTTFEGVEEIDGLETYKFRELVEERDAEVISGTTGLYSQDKLLWIEPKTGTIIDQQQSETRSLENGDLLLQLDAEFTDETVAANVEDTKSSVATLDLLGSTVPLVGFIGGLLLILVGMFLVFFTRVRGARVA